MTESRLLNLLKGKNVVYITVKNENYIRTKQIKRILSENAGSFAVYSSEKGNPISRALDIRKRLRDISFEGVDVVIVGFLPQLIWKNVTDRVSGNSDVVLVAEMFLSVFDTVVLDRKLVWKSGIIAYICKKLDKRVVKEADLVITDTNADAEYFSKEFGAGKDKFETLYLQADLDGILDDEPINNEKRAESKAVLYFGTGLPLQGTEYVARAFDVLTEEYGYKCTYIGGLKGMSRNMRKTLLSCENRAVKRGKGCMVYHKWLGQNELYRQISEADVCLAGHFEPDIDKADRTIPGKAMIYEAFGKSIILGDTKANRELFKSDDKHIFVPRGDFQKIVDAVINRENNL